MKKNWDGSCQVSSCNRTDAEDRSKCNHFGECVSCLSTQGCYYKASNLADRCGIVPPSATAVSCFVLVHTFACFLFSRVVLPAVLCILLTFSCFYYRIPNYSWLRLVGITLVIGLKVVNCVMKTVTVCGHWTKIRVRLVKMTAVSSCWPIKTIVTLSCFNRCRQGYAWPCM